MTKEQAVYAANLNLIGSDILDPSGRDAELVAALEHGRKRAAAGPHADCPKDGCRWTTAFEGPTDGEHFADLWEHLITRHGVDVRVAEDYAHIAWKIAAVEMAAV